MRIQALSKAVLVSLFMVVVSFASQADSTKITFLHSNDMGEISNKRGFGGFPELASLIEAEKKRNTNSIVTFGGDLISPSLMSGLSYGVEMVEMMNALGVDVAVLGNHEFDFGPDVARDRIAQSKFPWLASNVMVTGGIKELGSKSVFMKEVNGFKVGFLGVLTPETTSLSSPGENVKFTDVVEAANQTVAELKKQGAEVIVALTHMDLADDMRLAREVKGLNLILGGHDHRAFAATEGNTVILQAGSDLRYLGVVDLDVEWKEKRGKKYLSVIPSWKILATSNADPSSEIMAKVDGYKKQLDAKLDVVIGKTDIPLDTKRTSVRGKQTAFGQFIAKAMKEEVGADIGFTNGGGIRGDREYEAGSEITRKDILTELPFGNVTVLLEISGKDLQALVEHSVSKVEKGAGRYGQFVGLEFAYDVNKDVGTRVTRLTVGGAAVDPGKTYSVATNDYVAGGGDGYAMLKNSNVIIDKAAGTLMASTVMNYIEANGGIKKDFLK